MSFPPAEELEALVAALPADVTDRLAAGALDDPLCGVCTALKPNGSCTVGGDAGELLEEAHHVFGVELAAMFGGATYAEFRAARQADARLDAFADAVQAEIGAARCSAIYAAARAVRARRGPTVRS